MIDPCIPGEYRFIAAAVRLVRAWPGGLAAVCFLHVPVLVMAGLGVAT